MTPTDARPLLADLVDGFPRDRITDATVRLYSRMLADLPYELLEYAVNELLCTEDRFPSIRAIRAVVAEAQLQIPDEATAVMQISAKLHNPAAPRLHPAVREALDCVGGIHSWRTATEPGVIRGQFARYYRDIRAARILEAQVAPPALAALDRTQARPLGILPP